VLGQAAVEIAAETDALSQRAHVLFAHAEVLRLEGRARESTATAEDAVRLLERKGNVAAIKQARSLLPELDGA